MAKIQYIKDNSDVTVYPVTHERAVKDSNGVLLETKLAGKQDSLVSGTNIKTVNGESLLGSGNISAGDPDAVKYTTQSLTSAQQAQARTNIGATAPEVFWAEYGVTTATEINAQVSAGKSVFLLYQNQQIFNIPQIYCLFTSTPVTAMFYSLFSGGLFMISVYDSGSTTTWYEPTSDWFEFVDNKVTSWQNTPDDSHYPSEKLVKDSLDGKQPTIDAQHKLDYSLISNTPTIPTISTEVFAVTYGTTTQSEIATAVTAGKLPVCKYGDNVYVYAGESSAGYSQFTSILYNTAYRIYVKNSTWGSGSYEVYSKPSGGIPASDLVSGIVPTSASATIDANTGTPSVSVSMTNGNLAFAFSNLKGGQGDTGSAGAAAGFGTISATADATSSNSPTVTVTTSGDNTAKNISFAFSGLKGQKGDQGNSGYTGDLSELEVVNNLSDGGSTKALSAEQGMVVGDYLFGNFKAVDFSQLELRSRSLGANTASSNRWANNGQHYAIPITPNSRMQLRVSGYTGSYGFFTSAYVIPTGASSAVAYATGSERVWLTVSADFTEVTAPSNAAYLIVCPKDGNSNVCSWEVNIFQDPEIGDWVVDDLTTQDSKSPLSANMGYALDQKIDEEIENLQVVERKVDVTGYTKWTGNYINMTNNVWTATSGSKHFFIPVVPGRRYKITANNSYPTRLAMLTTRNDDANTTPDYATGWTAIQAIGVGQSRYFIAPEDAKYMSVALCISAASYVYTPSSIVEYIRKDELMPQSQWINSSKKGEIYLFCSGALGIDARTNSSTFGQVIGGRHDQNWSVTQYIDLMGANKIQYASTIKSTSSYMKDICGTVFYDENYEPITEGAKTIEYNSTALAGWIVSDVPDGARYFRTTTYFGEWDRTNKVYLFGNTPDVEFSGYTYEGEKIVLDPQDKFRWEQYGTGFLSGQSSACYGKYLFIVTKNLASVACVNLETKTTLYTLSPGFTSDTSWHCNQSSFGVAKYDENDMFPVLYISQRNNPQRAHIQVYRIIPTLTDNEISSFTMTLVQTIWLPAQSNFNSLGYPNITIDTENNKMWAYSRNNDQDGDTYGKATFTMFNIPALFNNGTPVDTVTLEDSDAKDRFRDNWSIYDNQGSFIHRGKLYMARGTGSDGICEINVIDLYYKRTRVSRLTMYAAGARFEPEGCFYYQGSIFFNGGTSIYKVILSD